MDSGDKLAAIGFSLLFVFLGCLWAIAAIDSQRIRTCGEKLAIANPLRSAADIRHICK